MEAQSRGPQYSVSIILREHARACKAPSPAPPPGQCPGTRPCPRGPTLLLHLVRGHELEGLTQARALCRPHTPVSLHQSRSQLWDSLGVFSLALAVTTCPALALPLPLVLRLTSQGLHGWDC